MKLIYLNDIIDYKNEKYFIDFIIQKENGDLMTCQKQCKDSKEADAVYKELQEIRDHDNPSNTITVNAETINKV